MNLLEDLKWRYAVKRFDDTKKVSQEKVDRILEAINLTPTSIGMQAFKVLIIEDKKLLERIYNESCQQVQVKECSHLLVFASHSELTEKTVDGFLDLTAKVRNMDQQWKDSYKTGLMAFANQNKDREGEWLSHQTYIALGFACVAAANERVDSVPIEGYNKEKFDALLGLANKGLKSTVLLPLGYRDAANDPLANSPKVRKDISDIVEIISHI